MEGMSARSLRALEEHEGASGGVYVAAKDTPSNDVLRDKPGIVAEKAEWSSQQHLAQGELSSAFCRVLFVECHVVRLFCRVLPWVGSLWARQMC